MKKKKLKRKKLRDRKKSSIRLEARPLEFMQRLAQAIGQEGQLI